MIDYNVNAKTLTFFLNGRINSTNASTVEGEINDVISAQLPECLIIDCGELEYISSAGLRIMLRLRKSYPEFKVVNVSPEVYDIFEMTGFTEMMEVRKAYREVSVEGCELIGSGANGQVYRLTKEEVLSRKASRTNRGRSARTRACTQGIRQGRAYRYFL